ncbi:MAG: glycosyl hydrolase 2 galactose-binding domain-containing protein [Bacteroidota bacterium]
MLVIVVGGSSCTSDPARQVHRQYLHDGWQLFSSDSVDAAGTDISSASFDDDLGYHVEVPSTVINGLMQNGFFEDIFEPFVLENMDKTPYEVPWWYRRVFDVESLSNSDFYQITFEGLNFKANIWINGTRIASEDSVQGSYGVWNFDVTPHLRKGENILAVEVIPPVFGEDISKGFVDWNPTPPDRSMGLWRGVCLRHTGPVSMRHSNVVSSVDKETLDEADLTLSSRLTNHSSSKQNVVLNASFDNISLDKTVTLQPHEKREVFFTSEEFPELTMEAPRLWWPNNMGEPHLYDLSLSLEAGGQVSDSEAFRFGIREIDDFWNEEGYRGFMVNGKKVMVKSAGWVDNIFLADPDEKVEAQMKYAKHLNLNSIRLESFWGRNRTIMEKADEYGLLLMLGWTAHWEWETYTGIPHDEYVTIRGEDKELHANNYRDQVLWHRRHPSVAIWTYGSDKLPRPSLEVMLNERMAKADTTRPILSYCGGGMLMEETGPLASEISGPTGVKMEGPYDWVPPVYWYEDSTYGGAFGFNTETGTGPQIPPISSIKKMLPEEHLWPIDSVWLYYSGRNQFKNLDRFLEAFQARYGETGNLEKFTFWNQIANYEAMRPMFEAFAVNKFNSTGVVQWMYNSAWPTFYWQLFDYYLMPTGAFYATRKAASPLLPVYNYGDRNIYVNNDHLKGHEDLRLEVTVLDINSKVLYESSTTFDIPSNSAIEVLDLPDIENRTTTWFLDFKLYNSDGEEVKNNFYWLSEREDVMEYDSTTWYWTPCSQYGDLTDLNNLPETSVSYDVETTRKGDELEFTVNMENDPEHLAFFVELQILDKQTGKPVLPVFWDDNYVSLLPGEQRELTGVVSAEDLDAAQFEVTLRGANTQ